MIFMSYRLSDNKTSCCSIVVNGRRSSKEIRNDEQHNAREHHEQAHRGTPGDERVIRLAELGAAPKSSGDQYHPQKDQQDVVEQASSPQANNMPTIQVVKPMMIPLPQSNPCRHSHTP